LNSPDVWTEVDRWLAARAFAPGPRGGA